MISTNSIIIIIFFYNCFISIAVALGYINYRFQKTRLEKANKEFYEKVIIPVMEDFKKNIEEIKNQEKTTKKTPTKKKAKKPRKKEK